ncbi:hypothetical protein FB451DRAFT_1051625 [Mycena latifolia]|nr:hypothetical protein FB451DRAFT_1051625 [Mycena latifolia]
MEPARIADCELENFEVPEDVISSVVETLFGLLEDEAGDRGSSHQQWYKSVATGKNAIVDDSLTDDGAFENSRLIAWKTGKPFHPENLFFRTVDSRRLLPMSLADFRVQFYAHKSFFEKMDQLPDGREPMMGQMLATYLHKILVLRNMHDKGGADIPIIMTFWDAERTRIAMDYWVALSKGEWTEEERVKQYTECEMNFCRRILPCFYQTDLLVRALLADPAVGYVPPFIIFHSVADNGKTCVLFTKPHFAPPPALVKGWPGECRDSKCPRSDCAAIDMAASRCLVDKTPMVREWSMASPPRVLCNLWGCGVQHAEDSDVKLQRCQRCREVLYCSAAHQAHDWHSHKRVCEKRS